MCVCVCVCVCVSEETVRNKIAQISCELFNVKNPKINDWSPPSI